MRTNRIRVTGRRLGYATGNLDIRRRNLVPERIQQRCSRAVLSVDQLQRTVGGKTTALGCARWQWKGHRRSAQVLIHTKK